MKFKIAFLFVCAIMSLNIYINTGDSNGQDDRPILSLKILEARADDNNETDPPLDPGTDPTPYRAFPSDLDSIYYSRYYNMVY